MSIGGATPFLGTSPVVIVLLKERPRRPSKENLLIVSLVPRKNTLINNAVRSIGQVLLHNRQAEFICQQQVQYMQR